MLLPRIIRTWVPEGTPVTVDNTLSGLNSGTTYYYRAVAASVEGEVKGRIQSFSTDFPPPAATTGSATSITTTGATFNGNVNPNGFSAETWFEYGTDNTLATFAPETAHQPKGSGTVDVSVNVAVASLTSYSTYYFRMVAQKRHRPGRIYERGDPQLPDRGVLRGRRGQHHRRLSR